MIACCSSPCAICRCRATERGVPVFGWRASQVRAQLVPPVRPVIQLAGLTPSLQAYDTLLEGEVAHVG